MESKAPPSVLSLIFADYASLLCFLGPTVTWGMFIAAKLGLIRDEPNETLPSSTVFLFLAAAATGICIPLLWYRVGTVYSLLRRGTPTRGVVTAVWLAGDRGRVDYEYTVDGQTYRGGMPLVRSDWAVSLQVGQEITVMVNAASPLRSIVAEVFK